MLREILEGYARADAFIQQERRAALVHMTPEQAWATFRMLWRLWAQAGRHRGDLEPLDALRIERLIQQRRKLDSLATNRA